VKPGWKEKRTVTERKPIRVGFIGTGWAERVQIPMFRLAGLTIQAVCSGNPEKARQAAQRHQIPQVFETWQALVAADTVDLVTIATPPHLHRAMAIAALQAGKHVICEKPMALNVAEAEAMLAAAQAAPNQLAIIDHELRFHPQRIHLRQLIKDGYIGHVLLVNIAAQAGSRLNPATPWGWWDDAAQGGGMLGAIGSHMLDLSRWLVGKIDRISAQLQIGHFYRQEQATGVQRQVTADDHAQILLRFANGAQGSITVSGLIPGGAGNEILIVGTQGALTLDPQDRLWGTRGEEMSKGDWQPIETGFPAQLPDEASGSQPYAAGTFYFAQALAALPSGQASLPEAASFYDGLAVQRALDAAQRSHRQQIWAEV
jgi:predicted dehydrogenase